LLDVIYNYITMGGRVNIKSLEVSKQNLVLISHLN